jgi:predicted alpha/beta-fold hydrolase
MLPPLWSSSACMSDVALDDAMRLFQHVKETCSPSRILVAGTSLGGNIARRLCARLEDKNIAAEALLLECPFLGTHALRLRFLRFFSDMVSVRMESFLALEHTSTVVVTGGDDQLIDNAVVRQRLGLVPGVHWFEAARAGHNTVTKTLAWEEGVSRWLSGAGM